MRSCAQSQNNLALDDQTAGSPLYLVFAGDVFSALMLSNATRIHAFIPSDKGGSAYPMTR
jgi:hypothetical protein